MNQLGKIILSMFGIIITVYLTTLFMGFLEVPIGTYGSYLGWFVALVVFFAILPSRVGTMFS